MRYVPSAAEGDGIEFEWGAGDKTLVQFDHSSLTPENSHMETLSIYRLLVHLEKTMKLTEHKVSYTDCTRQRPCAGSTVDGFELTINSSHKYITLTDLQKPPHAKNVFAQVMGSLKDSHYLGGTFRFRYERVHGTLKVQKPYVVTSRAIELKAKSLVLVVP